MDKHITIVAALRIGCAAMNVIIAGIILLLLMGPGVIAQCVSGDAEALMILTAIAFPIALFLMLAAAINLIGGIGILKHKNWARYLVMILSVLDLFNIPMGTVLGIYCIWALAQDEAARIFTTPAAE